MFRISWGWGIFYQRGNLQSQSRASLTANCRETQILIYFQDPQDPSQHTVAVWGASILHRAYFNSLILHLTTLKVQTTNIFFFSLPIKLVSKTPASPATDHERLNSKKCGLRGFSKGPPKFVLQTHAFLIVIVL